MSGLSINTQKPDVIVYKWNKNGSQIVNGEKLQLSSGKSTLESHSTVSFLKKREGAYCLQMIAEEDHGNQLGPEASDTN